MQIIRRVLLVVSLVIIGGSATAATLIHEYTFDNGTANDSIGSINGTLVNGASISGGLLQLDGIDDFVQLNGLAIPTTGEFSVAVRAQQTRTQTKFVELISQGSSQTGSVANGFYIGHDPSGNMRVGDQNLTTSVPYPTDGEFHDFVVTSSAVSGTTLYIDGIAVFNNPNAFPMQATGTSTRIGTQFQTFNEYFAGNIDDVRIYQGALTEEEINGGVVVPLPATVWMMLVALSGLGLLRRST